MTKTLYGCSYNEPWGSPADWKTTTAKAALKKEWYVQCYFHDPEFEKYEPKGFPYRTKLNKYKKSVGIAGMKSLFELAIQEMKAALDSGYNPITGLYMAGQEPEQYAISETNSDTPFIDALKWAFSKLDVADTTQRDVSYILNSVKRSSEQLRYSAMPVGQIKRKHIRLIIDNLEKSDGMFSGHKFNKYRSYLKLLYNVLLDYEIIETNIINDIRKKKVTKNVRETLTLEERIKIHDALSAKFPRFLDFIHIYFHSGGRIAELLRLKVNEIDLDKKRYKTLIKKGAYYKWINRTIKDIALPVWKRVIEGAKGNDFAFSVGLVPGPTAIRREQITRRWATHVKDKLGITADFSSMKHSNLDEIAAISGLEDAAKAAGHTNTAMVKNVYAVGEAERQEERIRKMKNEFAPNVMRAV